jgi:hypothetical protein
VPVVSEERIIADQKINSVASIDSLLSAPIFGRRFIGWLKRPDNFDFRLDTSWPKKIDQNATHNNYWATYQKYWEADGPWPKCFCIKDSNSYRNATGDSKKRRPWPKFKNVNSNEKYIKDDQGNRDRPFGRSIFVPFVLGMLFGILICIVAAHN